MSCRPFRKTGLGVLFNGEVNSAARKPERKRKSAVYEGRRLQGRKSLERNPKPVDLSLGRLKPLEREVEDRTGTDVQIVRITWV